MTVPLLEAITTGLVTEDFAVLRFNFRGVGRSTGAHDQGIGEVDDVSAAVSRAAERYPGLPLGIAGWSFGAATALCWQARDRSSLPYVGIAPGVLVDGHRRLPRPEDLPPGRRTIIVGDRDRLIDVAALTAYAADIGAELHTLEGSDHFFYFREAKVSALVAAGLG